MKLKLILLAGTIALSACGKSDTSSVTLPDGKGGSATIESSKSSATITDSDGKKLTISNGGDASSLPEYASLYPGAKSGEVSNMKTAEVNMTTAVSTTPDSGDKVIAYYKSKFEAAGFKIAMEMNTGEEKLLMANTNGQMADNAAGTSVTLVVKPKNDESEISIVVNTQTK